CKLGKRSSRGLASNASGSHRPFRLISRGAAAGSVNLQFAICNHPLARVPEFAIPDRAYERLVDRLLASPHYGERWGRHWLDAAGYIETLGTEQDANAAPLLEGIWRYRDYVIRSLNEDKPYDRFLLEQIAGDEQVDWRKASSFTPAIVDSLVATG